MSFREKITAYFGSILIIGFVIGSLAVFSRGVMSLLALMTLPLWLRVTIVLVSGIGISLVSILLQDDAPIFDALAATIMTLLITGLILGLIGEGIQRRNRTARTSLLNLHAPNAVFDKRATKVIMETKFLI